MVPAVRPLGSLSMAQGCARIDSRLDTAKIGSAGRLEVHRARLLAVIGVRKTFPHGLGQKRKYSVRADVLRFTPKGRHRQLSAGIYPFARAYWSRNSIAAPFSGDSLAAATLRGARFAHRASIFTNGLRSNPLTWSRHSSEPFIEC